METSGKIEQLASLIEAQGHPEGYSASTLPGLGYVIQSHPSPIECTIYEPVACLILRGRKTTVAGPLAVDIGPGESLIVSHDLPVLSRINEAPYLALIQTLDSDTLRALSPQIQEHPVPGDQPQSLAVDSASNELLDAFIRYVLLEQNPSDAIVLAPLVLKEIHYRLATAPNGTMLRRLLRADGVEATIDKAIQEIRANFRATLSVQELASGIGMSESTFHRHFKTITGTTPLQYQKSLRLLEARRLISTAGLQVSSAAYEVGYASSTQFSREYSREFGASPRQHLVRSS